jgi:hypothetical protein
MGIVLVDLAAYYCAPPIKTAAWVFSQKSVRSSDIRIVPAIGGAAFGLTESS